LRKLSEQSLGNAALHYLKRYSASRKGLERVLERKVKRVIRDKGGDLEAAKPMIAAVVERMVRAGYVDDARLAEAKTASMRRQGKSSRVIRFKLREKGIEPGLAAQATETTDAQELESALALARRKKLGRDPERRQKDLAVLLRAGFTFGVAKRALQATVPT
jgi:regulatory protein